MKQNHSMRNRIWIAVGAVIILIVLAIIFIDIKAVFQLLGRVDWLMLLASVVPLLAGFALITIRWRYILAGKPLRRKTFYADSIGYMTKLFTPVPLAVIRVATVSWVTAVSVPQASSGMVVERLLEITMRLITLIVLLTLFTAGYADAAEALLLGAILIVVTLGAISLLLKHREPVVTRLVVWLSRLPIVSDEQLRDNLNKMMQGLDMASSRRRLAVGLLISVVMWTFFLAFQYLALYAVPSFMMSWETTLAIALTVLIVVPPSTIPMIGMYQMIVIGLLLAFGAVNSTEATAYAIILFIPQMVCWMIFGIWALFRTDVKFSDLLQAAEHLAEKQSPEQPEVTGV